MERKKKKERTEINGKKKEKRKTKCEKIPGNDIENISNSMNI